SGGLFMSWVIFMEKLKANMALEKEILDHSNLRVGNVDEVTDGCELLVEVVCRILTKEKVDALSLSSFWKDFELNSSLQ
ncbi:hypothetical protein MKW92_045205, partial [Papaver armeniacum]